MYCVAKETLSFYLDNYGIIEIKEGQQLRGMKSRKFSEEDAVKLLESNNFKIDEVLDNSNKMKMFITHKI
jgi:hypothetical protein